ncbi:MAG: transglycosylase SLT domain-containing protein [bacterium]
MRHTSSIFGTIVLALCALQPSAMAAQSADSLPRQSVPGAVPVPRADIPVVSRADVTRRAADVFGDSIATIPKSLLGTDSLAALVPSWDIDVRSYETRDRVAHYVDLFSGRARERITERLERGSRYEGLIRAKMKAGGIPEDMYYLALVESGFDPNAYSKAAAVGMWQFMTGTGRDMGMRIDWWVDERRDPVKSTSAAVRFIRDLRDQFGSLYLAAAAYNGGPGRVARGLVRYADDLQGAQGEDAFFLLAEKDYLKNETRDYVPQLIAAALIAKDPARYGMELHPRPAFEYDSVTVPAATPLAIVARAAGTTTAGIKELNPHILRGMTPPRDSSTVRIPLGAAVSFDSSFATIPKEERTSTKTVESRKGETAAAIGRAHGISEAAILAFNPKLRRLKSGRLASGQTVLVPSLAVAEAAVNVPDPSIEKYPKASKSKKSKKASKKKASTKKKTATAARKKAKKRA